MYDSLIAPDPELVRQRLPVCTEGEFERYEWDVSNGRKLKEVPVDKFNHGMDAMRYIVMHADDASGLITTLDAETADAISNWRGY